MLIGDHPAESTLAVLAARHCGDPAKGYVEYFLDQLRPHLAERGTRVVVNAGGFNRPDPPVRCARWSPGAAPRCASRTPRVAACCPQWMTCWPPGTRCRAWTAEPAGHRRFDPVGEFLRARCVDVPVDLLD